MNRERSEELVGLLEELLVELRTRKGEDEEAIVPEVVAYYTSGEEQGEQGITIQLGKGAPMQVAFSKDPAYEDLSPEYQLYTGLVGDLLFSVPMAERIVEALDEALANLPKDHYRGDSKQMLEAIEDADDETGDEKA